MKLLKTMTHIFYNSFYFKNTIYGTKILLYERKKFVRYYPTRSEAPSKFSENTTEKDLREYHANLDKKVEDIKDRTEDHEDKITLEFEFCSSKEDASKLRESLSNNVKSESAKYLEEIKEDSELEKESLDYSSFTTEGKEAEKNNIQKHVENIQIEEGKSLMQLLNLIEKTYRDTCKHIDYVEEVVREDLLKEKLESNKDSSSSENKVENKDPGSSENKQVESKDSASSEHKQVETKDPSSSENKQVETKDVQSPIDFVVEREQCNMPDIPNSDGGE